ncbi:phosphatidylinositol-4-phosphate 5-kinase-like protein [Leptomonas seymouri]|uniref:Phosphatidylinositol-4-phosphate 5-kinase-like protein n=1 Tax=Leptomonas seymouri TaxID=5684 RepID=A0A0N1PAY9_LEPSE|nr:phosphatidylinositol-4-phosphate 5-kinase-like protein [Leptomonas seymouri]|eukprot:KPI85070.1 phosphatidylinositol-4-phosphate 5-kinase-like protein [Leptomonas seymouri]
MTEATVATAAARPPLNATPPSGDAAEVENALSDPSLKKKKRLLNGANIKYTFPSGATYEGSFKDGKIEGYGEYTYAQTGDVYTGEWKADQKHGQGTYKCANGDRYVGQWYMGNRHGKGQFAFANGDEYVGSWRDNKMNGYGIFLVATSGDRYSGYWKGGLRQGSGTLRYGNGDLYDGEWNAGHQHGIGVFYQSNGDIYCGDWKGGVMDGKGVLREKGIMFLVEYVGGYLISKMKLTEATDELDNEWSVVYKHFFKWLDEKEIVNERVKNSSDADKLKEELEASHMENSILRKRLDDAMRLFKLTSCNPNKSATGSFAERSLSKEAMAAAYFRDGLQKAETKVKLLECTLAERAVEIRKLTDLVSSSEAKLKELEIGRAGRKSLAPYMSNKAPVVDVIYENFLEAAHAASSGDFNTDVEVEELKAQNRELLQLTDDLQRKTAFLSAENSKLDLKREAAEEQYEKLSEQMTRLRAKLEKSALISATPPMQGNGNLSQILSYELEPPVAPSLESTAIMDVEELQKRLVQANQLNIELRLRNGELQQQCTRRTSMDEGAASNAAIQELVNENEAFRSTIAKLKQQVAALQSASDDAEQRLFVSKQQLAELEGAMEAMAKEKSANPQLQRILEGKSDQITKLQLENAELARLLDESQACISEKGRAAAIEKQRLSVESATYDGNGAEVASLQKKVKKLQKSVKKVTSERNTVAEQFYDSQIHLARAHRVLGSLQGQLIIFASLFDMDTGNESKEEPVLKIDETDPSRMILAECSGEREYRLDYCFGRDATATQILSEVRDVLSFVWSGFQFGLLTIGEFRSGKTKLVTQLFPLFVQCLLQAAEESSHRSHFSFTYRVAVVEVSAGGGYDCASEEIVEEIRRDANGYVHPQKARFIDCTSVSISAVVESLLTKRRQRYNGRSHTWIQLQCVRTGLVQQSHTVGRLTFFDWCGPGSLLLQKTDIESARFANASSQALKDVVDSLSAKDVAVPYTKSLETALLYDLLGGNSITAVIGRLRSTPEHVEESIRTLGVLSALFGARNAPLLQDAQTHDEIRWRGLISALISDDQAERELAAVGKTREF